MKEREEMEECMIRGVIILYKLQHVKTTDGQYGEVNSKVHCQLNNSREILFGKQQYGTIPSQYASFAPHCSLDDL